jgi:hypothetical protein
MFRQTEQQHLKGCCKERENADLCHCLTRAHIVPSFKGNHRLTLTDFCSYPENARVWKLRDPTCVQRRETGSTDLPKKCFPEQR